MNTEIEQTQISVSGIAIDVIKKDIKNMHLAVYPPTGRVHISSPADMNTESVRMFAVSKLGWIRKHIRATLSSSKTVSPSGSMCSAKAITLGDSDTC